MKKAVKTLAVVLVGAGVVAFAAAPAVCADEFCAMGGMQIKAEVVKAKAIEWGKDRKKAVVAAQDTESWSVLTLSRSEDDIAILVTNDSVFFGVAGKGGNEVDARDAEKAFGRDNRKLSAAVSKELTDLYKDGVVRIQGADIQQILNAVGFGILEKGRDWELKTQNCKGMDVAASDLK